MKNSRERGALDQVRAAKRQISKQFDHDPRKLVEHYIALQQKYRNRLIGTKENVRREEAT